MVLGICNIWNYNNIYGTLYNIEEFRSFLMDSKVLELINQMIVLIIYGIVLSREISHQTLDIPNTIITIGGIIFSVILMFFIWHLKNQELID